MSAATVENDMKISRDIYVCNHCNKESLEPLDIEIHDKAGGMVSFIENLGGQVFELGPKHYCSVDCLINDIKNTLEGK